MKSIFIDSDVLIGLHYVHDALHKQAIELFSHVSLTDYNSYLSWNVILETLTVVSQRISKPYAIELLSEFRSGKYTVIHPNEELISSAEEIFRSIRSKNVSYSDCVSFAVMRRYGIEWTFSFDLHFKKMGFKRVGIDK